MGVVADTVHNRCPPRAGFDRAPQSLMNFEV